MRKIANKDFYTKSLKAHHRGVKALHWNSEVSQFTRFDILQSLLPSDMSTHSLVDAGCGFGDFYLYLQEHNKTPKKYIGLDVMPEMVEESIAKTGCDIYVCDIINDALIEADYYVCSGAMNILSAFETHLFIKKCLDASRIAFVFNLLKGHDDSMVYNYFLPSKIEKMAKEFQCNVEIVEGYMLNDFSVKLSKKEYN